MVAAAQRAGAPLRSEVRQRHRFSRVSATILRTGRAAGWSLEEFAYYLGHITKSSTSAIQTTIRYTQVSREHVKEKLKLLRG